MLSPELAQLYGVEAKVLVQAVKRNIARFPADFMFQLTWEEFGRLKSQIVTSKPQGRGGLRRAAPYAFTEQGVAMLSTVLRSKRAIEVNIEIMRAFVRVRQVLAVNQDLGRKLSELERKHDARLNQHDAHFRVVFQSILRLLEAPKAGESVSRRKRSDTTHNKEGSVCAGQKVRAKTASCGVRAG
jgi:hypothetical protein